MLSSLYIGIRHIPLRSTFSSLKLNVHYCRHWLHYPYRQRIAIAMTSSTLIDSTISSDDSRNRKHRFSNDDDDGGDDEFLPTKARNPSLVHQKSQN
jgi:hypothetical protein